MIQRKWASSFVLSVSMALAMGVGCSSSEKEDDDGVTCTSLCEASGECSSMDACMAECEAISGLCPSETQAYLDCTEGAAEYTCIAGVSIGFVTACASEGLALQSCADPSGDGDGDNGGAGGAP